MGAFEVYFSSDMMDFAFTLLGIVPLGVVLALIAWLFNIAGKALLDIVKGG